jgi:hypothetical protein
VTPTWEELTVSRIPYNGKEIRTDGYFTSSLDKNNTYSDFVFYKNGVAFSFRYSNKIKDYYHDSINNERYIDDVNRIRQCCSVYQIANDTIYIQGWRDFTHFVN